MEGEVKFFNHKKAFGFIKSNEDEKEYFVHITGIVEGTELNDGAKVNFELEKDDKGQKAVKVSLLN